MSNMGKYMAVLPHKDPENVHVYIYTSIRGKIRAGTTVPLPEWGIVCPSALIICASPFVCHTHIHGLLSLCRLRR